MAPLCNLPTGYDVRLSALREVHQPLNAGLVMKTVLKALWGVSDEQEAVWDIPRKSK